MKNHESYTTVHPMLMVEIILIIPLLSGPSSAAEPATLQS